MAPKSHVSMPGASEGKLLIGAPTGDETPMQRVNALLEKAISEEAYQVSPDLCLSVH